MPYTENPSPKFTSLALANFDPPHLGGLSAKANKMGGGVASKSIWRQHRTEYD